MSTTEKNVKILPFSGKKSEFSVWSEQYLARAFLKGWKKVVDGTEKIPSESTIATYMAIEETNRTDDQKKAIKVDKANKEAYSDLILSMEGTTTRGKVAFKLVKSAKTTANPSGDVSLAWKKLMNKYEPSTSTEYVDLQEKFFKAKLVPRGDPELYITYLEDLRQQMDVASIPGVSHITDVDMMTHILGSLPDKEYDGVLKDLQKRLGKSGTGQLTLEELENELKSWHKFKNKRAVGRTDQALAAVG